MYLLFLQGYSSESLILDRKDYQQLLQLATYFGCIPRIDETTSVVAHSDLVRLHKGLWHARMIIETSQNLTLEQLTKRLEQTLKRTRQIKGYEELTTLKSIIRCHQVIQDLRARNLDCLISFIQFLFTGRYKGVGYYYL